MIVNVNSLKKFPKPNQGILFNLEFFRNVVYTNFTKENVIFLTDPVTEVVNQILFVTQEWPKE